jgi:hydrogenase nickel incorporation protein HypA/HybF
MHEFSLASEVINIVQREAEKRNSAAVNEITIEVGSLSGVEADAFESALKLLSPGTIMNNSELNILRTNGKGRCSACSIEFDMIRRIDACPLCNAFPAEVNGGNEFRIVSITIE